MQPDKAIDIQTKTVLTYGTFDTLHYGHIEFLKRAASYGGKLIVFVSTDEFNELSKGKKAVLPYEKRRELVGWIKNVDKVLPEKDWAQKPSDIFTYGANVVVFGSDWEGEFDYLKSYGVDVVYLPRTPGISSTMIREKQSGNGKMEKAEEDGQSDTVEAG